ncbi:NADH-quinone oxidoreductase subunit D [Porphyromonadaceae bacterium OttesenSCG-928-L07]|nr:NADH-quinone oxidoreductase subunit D [Porphyromonadaceae bacterium OttesenSCG-928-L07]MDL2251466.1 NADH-quinone oxidoreductase subunit D [Odoribacter sp. OttesenSCG-928-J03]MDL2282963.1 NADH-quinone oxidoreductase subunit D [Odoribacter sp. OttesenSCG-928-G04]
MTNNIESLSTKLSALGYAEVEHKENRLTVTLPMDALHETAALLRNEEGYDFLVDIVGMDYGDRLGAIYYLSKSTDPLHLLVLKTSTGNKETPELFSVCDLWDSAEIYEREVYDFFGIVFINHPDMRRIFLRSDWNGHPLRKDYDADPKLNPIPHRNEFIADMERVPTLTMSMGKEVESTHHLFDKDEYIVNFGPQHPAMHGVLHLRASLDGEIIKKIDPNFGYIHRGIEKMCEGYTYPQILHLTDRLDYLSGTMNRHAVCLCVEKALEIEVSERAKYVRTIFDELTRIASHLLGWGCMCMDMGSITAFVYGMRDREKIMDIFEETAGGRLMVNYNVIGGLANDIHPNFRQRVKEFIPYMRKMMKEHHMLFTGNPIARGRMKGIGRLSKEKAISLGATGPTGRASGWSNDIRKIAPYAAYDKVDFEEVLRPEGLTFDRYIIRLDEIEQSLRIIEQLIDNIPEGPYVNKPKGVIKLPAGDYFQRVENARGQFGVHITSAGDKTPYRVKFRSPCLVLVGALKAIAPENKVADLIMLGASLDYVIPCIDR